MKLPLALAVLASCGSIEPPSPDAAADATTDVEPSDASSDIGTADVADVESPLAEAGLFTCVDCLCDGRTSYCRGFFKGNAPITDAGATDASMCTPADASALSGCVPYPSACAQAPTCTCLVTYQPQPACGCAEVEGGTGFDVSCYLP